MHDAIHSRSLVGLESPLSGDPPKRWQAGVFGGHFFRTG